MKLKLLISIISILILVVSALAGCDTATTPEKEPPQKEQPKKDEPYSSSKPKTKEPRDEKEPTEKDTEEPCELATVTRIVDGDTISYMVAEVPGRVQERQ